MRGVILAIAPDGTYGQLSAEDGQRYSYWTTEVRNGRVQVGQTVEFQMWEGQPIDIVLVSNAAPPQAAPRPGQPMPVADRAGAPSSYSAAASDSGTAQASYGRRGKLIPPYAYWITLFTSPSGRISRRQFWLHGVLPIVVASIVLGWIPVIGQILSLLFMWASICISFKRFHDLGYPGWYSLFYLVPTIAAMLVIGVGILITSLLGVAWLIAKILWAIALLVGLAQLIFVYVRVGQEGPNEYGPDPLES